MSAQLTSSKSSALLTRVQLNPEIGTDNAAAVADLVQIAAEDLVSYSRFRRYPELSKGFAKSILGTDASEDISALSTNSMTVSVNGSAFFEIKPTLASLTTGTAIATELQTLIRADSTDGADEVTVAHAGTGATSQYTITSGRYGEGSLILVSTLSEDFKHVPMELGLPELWGGIAVFGSAAREEADDVVVEMVSILYRHIGLEGLLSGSVPGDITFETYADEFSPSVLAKLQNMRRVYP